MNLAGRPIICDGEGGIHFVDIMLSFLFIMYKLINARKNSGVCSVCSIVGEVLLEKSSAPHMKSSPCDRFFDAF